MSDNDILEMNGRCPIRLVKSSIRYRRLKQNNNDVERVDGRCLLKQNSGLKDENNSVGHRCTKNVIE